MGEVDDVDDFYEDDEPLDKIVTAFERGHHSTTAPPSQATFLTPPVSRTVTNGGTVRAEDLRINVQPQISHARERVNSTR